MAKLSIVAGTTSKLIDVFIQDSSSTTGAGLTGLVFNSGSLTAYYYREGAASATAMTLVTMTVGTWTSLGFIAIDGTNMPGCYQIGLPNAAIASGAKSVLVMLKGATNMAPLVLEIELTAVDNQDAVRGGMTALPNANAAASGGLIINGSNAGTVTLAALTVTGNFAVQDGMSLTASTANRAAFSAVGNGTGQGGIFLSGGGATAHGLEVRSQATTGGDGFRCTKAGTGYDIRGVLGVGSIINTTFAAGAIDAAAIADNAIDAATFVAGTLATEATITAAVWNEPISGHLTAGTTGKALSDSAAASPTAAQVATAVWQDAVAGDFTVASSIGKALYINNVVPGGSGGHLISGTNAGTTTLGALTVTGNFAVQDGMTLTAATANRAALSAVGNGTAQGAVFTGGGSGGNGIEAKAQAVNGIGMLASGFGTGPGLRGIGGAAGNGIEGTGGATSGDGAKFAATTDGHGVEGIGVGTSRHGVNATGGNTTSHGINAQGGGLGHGFNGQGGGTAGGAGAKFTGGAAGGPGLQAAAQLNSSGIDSAGNGTGHGMLLTPGATGSGLRALGGTTSGAAIFASGTAGNAPGFLTQGQGSGSGMQVLGGTTGDGLTAAKGASGGVDIRGNLAGSVSSVTLLATGAIAATSFVAGAIDATAIADNAIDSNTFATGTLNTVADIVTGVWGEPLPGSYAVGSAGKLLSSAGTAADPWSTVLPGSYPVGTAGNIMGVNLDTRVSTRLAPTTAGRTLDVSTTGEAGVDWANVGGQATVVSLSATTIQTVSTVAGGGITAASIAPDAIGASELAADGVAEIASQVWDTLLAAHTSPGTAGSAMAAAGSAGDPWATPLPGGYAAGTAGNIVGKIGTPAGATIAVDIAAINAKTSALPATPAAVGSQMTLAPAEYNSIADALLDRTDAIELGMTFRQYCRGTASKAFGLASGGNTGLETFRAAVSNSKARLTFTDDSAGNRSNVAVDLT